MVYQVTTEEEFKTKIQTEKLVLVDFFATWCGPCKRIVPDLERLESQYSDVIFIKVDVDDLEDISNEYKVQALPTFLFIRDGNELSRVKGADVSMIESKLQSYALSAFDNTNNDF